MKHRLVLYHSHCLDGFTAAWAAYKRFGDSAEYIPVSYGDEPPPVDGREVYVVDFSYPRDVLIGMKERAATLRVLDHHKSAAEALAGLDYATFDMNRSGAGITWDELHAPTVADPRSWLVDYVEDRDLWRFKLPASKEINAWIGACRRDSFTDWDVLAATPIEQVITKGGAVLQYIDRYVHEMCEQARTIHFEGYDDIPIVNAPYICISELVGKLAERAPFAVGWFHRSDGRYAYSLRSRGPDGVDVSEVAKRFNGGGHRNAAGFWLPSQYLERPAG